MTIDLANGEAQEARLAALAVLSQQTRELMDAVTLSDVDETEMAAVTAELVALTERLRAVRRDAPRPHEVGPDGAFRHLGNAVTGACNPHALPLEIERTPEGGSRASVTFRPMHEGPPSTVHGGVVAMVLDHLLGDAVAASGRPGMTGTLTIRYRQRVPYGEPVVASAIVTRGEGRKTWVEGSIALPDGTPLVEATGLFITPAVWADAIAALDEGRLADPGR
ncbi:PaaI family thioesterase [Planotetraspora sp. A-T 1434]|uniref:PaaI family thioesterase n=1 Tax=Planotetraspora sp. A-T 1434 TaxID=2979219 RepID=UPI0021C0D9FD|nr:PaaI family thioesterase [Planotetraspora sp. A-T 1434]MCT9933978.1 PaaI family thioesterase [Planotetraspora sp. A-T 1434]